MHVAFAVYGVAKNSPFFFFFFFICIDLHLPFDDVEARKLRVLWLIYLYNRPTGNWSHLHGRSAIAVKVAFFAFSHTFPPGEFHTVDEWTVFFLASWLSVGRVMFVAFVFERQNKQRILNILENEYSRIGWSCSTCNNQSKFFLSAWCYRVPSNIYPNHSNHISFSFSSRPVLLQ